MSETRTSPSCDSAPSSTGVVGAAPDWVPDQPGLTPGQVLLAPPRVSPLHALLSGVVGAYILSSLWVAMLVIDVESLTLLVLATLLVSGGVIGIVGTFLVAQSKRKAWWVAWGVLIGLGLSFLLACILPYYF